MTINEIINHLVSESDSFKSQTILISNNMYLNREMMYTLILAQKLGVMKEKSSMLKK